jgi:hypothetical protein
MKKIFNLLFVLLICAASGWLYFDGRLYQLLEREAPVITWVTKPEFVGYKPYKLSFTVEDRGSGVSNVVVTASGAGADNKLISHEIYSQKERFDSKTLSFVVDPKEFGVTEGKLNLDIVVSDSSLWKNLAAARAEVIIDRELPSIEVASKHHYGAIGGTVVVWYRIHSDDVARSGVRYGNSQYLGSPVKDFDSRFDSDTGLFVVMVPLARDTSRGSLGPLRAFAVDKAGNERLVDFNQQIKPRIFPKARIDLNQSFISKVVPDLHPEFEKLFPGEPSSEYSVDMEDMATIQMFRDVNERLRQKNAEMVLALADRTAADRMPLGIIKPLPASLTGAFGEVRSFFLHGKEAGGSVHEGYDLADTLGASVRAAADGTVLHAGPFGIYGNAIVIDHGLGFQTLYGHLSVVGVKVGDMVTSGMSVGATGMTGLAGGDHLHFETRLHGVAVDPKEWLDSNWIETRIKGPLVDLLANQTSYSHRQK